MTIYRQREGHQVVSGVKCGNWDFSYKGKWFPVKCYQIRLKLDRLKHPHDIKTSKMKLTKAQKFIINKMRAGEKINVTRRHTSITLSESETRILDRTFDALCRNGLIKSSGSDSVNNYYELTELGKSISL